MDELLKASSDRLAPASIMGAPRPQANLNFGQYSQPWIAQELCFSERSVRQESVIPSTINYGHPVVSSKVGRNDPANSFLALLSGPSLQLHSECQQSSSVRPTSLSASCPLSQSNNLESVPWPSLASSDISFSNVTVRHGGFNGFTGPSQLATSKELSSSGYSKVAVHHHENLEPSNFRPVPDAAKQACTQNVPQGEADLQGHISQWLNDSSNVRTQQSECGHSVRLSKHSEESSYDKAEESLLMTRPRQRVFCVVNNKLSSGELVLSNNGRFGVICACHNKHMSIARFTEHFGMSHTNPGLAVRMENGDCIATWLRALFLQLGVHVPDVGKFCYWDDENRNEAESTIDRIACHQTVDKENASTFLKQHCTNEVKNTLFKNCNTNSLEELVGQTFSGHFVQPIETRGKHELHDTVSKNINVAATPVQLNVQLQQKLKENMRRFDDMSYNCANRSSQKYGTNPVAEYIDFISNTGQQIFTDQGSLGIRSFPSKNFVISCLNDASSPASNDKDTSGFELRLGQPNVFGSSFPEAFDCHSPNSALNRQKALFLEHKFRQAQLWNSLEECERSRMCDMLSGVRVEERGKSYENQRYSIGSSSNCESGYINQIRGDYDRMLTSSWYPSSGQLTTRIKDVPFQYTSKGPVDLGQPLSKAMHWSPDSSMMKVDRLGNLREKTAGSTDRNVNPNIGCASFLSQSKHGITMTSSNGYEMNRSSPPPLMKQRLENRLLHETYSAHDFQLDISNNSRQTKTNEASNAFPVVEPSIKTGINPSGLSCNFGSADQFEVLWQRAMNKMGPKSPGYSLPDTVLNSGRARSYENTYKAACEATKVNSDPHWWHHITDEQLRNLVDTKNGNQVLKSTEGLADIPIQELKSVMDRMHGQLTGLCASTSLPVQHGNNQGEMQDYDRNRDNISEKASHISNSGDGQGLSMSAAKLCTIKGHEMRCFQPKDSFGHQTNGSMLDPHYRSNRLSQHINPPEEVPKILEKNGLSMVSGVENMNMIGETVSNGKKEAIVTDFTNQLPKKSEPVAIRAAASTVIASVGENESQAMQESFACVKRIATHQSNQNDCHLYQENDGSAKCIAESSSMHAKNTTNFIEKKRVDDHLSEQQMSNICSKGSENVVSDFSCANGHAMGGKSYHLDSESHKVITADVVDEGSGIGKCCSSDGMDTGICTRSKPVDANSKKNQLRSDSQLENLPHGINGGSKTRTSVRLKRVPSNCNSVSVDHRLEKRRKPKKWKHLDETSRLHKIHEPNSNSNPLMSNVNKKTIANDTEAVTASVSSSPIQLLGLKRKRSVSVSNSSTRSMQRPPQDQDVQRKDNSVQQVQLKGDKLVIRLRQGSSEGKGKQGDVNEVECGTVSLSSKKMVDYENSISKNRYFPDANQTKPSNDNLKDAKFLKSVVSKPVKGLPGKSTTRSNKMASLRSILSCPEKKLDNGANPCSELACKAAGHDKPCVNDNGVKIVKIPSRQKCLSKKAGQNSLLESATDSGEIHLKDYAGIDSFNGNRKQSLCQVPRNGNSKNKMTNTSISIATNESKPFFDIDIRNNQASEKGTLQEDVQGCGEIVKYVGRNESQKPVSTMSSCTTNCFPQSHYSPEKLLSDQGLKIPKVGTSQNHSKSTIILMEATAAQKADSGVMNFAREKAMNENMPLVNMKKTKRCHSFSNISKKKKQQSNEEAPIAHCDEFEQIIFGSSSSKAGHHIPIKKRGSDYTLEDTPTVNHIVKRKKIENSRNAYTVEPEAPCSVCRNSNEMGYNRLVQCSSCFVKVHQECYGVSKMPKTSWKCRACKSNLLNIVCVLCGYGGGAMTRATKTHDVVKSLLHAWKAKGDRSNRISQGDLRYLPPNSKVGTEIDAACYQGTCEQNWKEAQGTQLCSANFFFPEKQDNGKVFVNMLPEVEKEIGSCQGEPAKNRFKFSENNTITAAVNDHSISQWVHMVCGLWTPGTKCVNVSTMGVFDVSGASIPRRKQVCSICNRPGGLCIQCRVEKCLVPFHPWCAHQQGLLQSEVEGDNGDKVGFYGRCRNHAKDAVKEQEAFQTRDDLLDKSKSGNGEGTCARTEGYKAGKSWNDRSAETWKQLVNDNAKVVCQEQINAWLHINGRRSCTRAVVKTLTKDVKPDYRKEYIRFKQEQRWKRLVVYKSGIHALGLYTIECISKGEMVVEYVGEIIGQRVADKREAYYHSRGKMQREGACYFFRIDNENIIDATRKGGIARFVNHSCLPNCVAKVISVRTQKKVVFFAERDINAGEEITYDYNFNREDDGKKIPCFCKSRICRLYLN